MDNMIHLKKINNWLVDSPEGYVPFEGISLIEKQKTYKYKSLQGSKNHIIFEDGKEQKLGDIGTITNRESYLYDLIEVKNSKHHYYTNGITSHNCKFLGGENSLLSAACMSSLVFQNPVKTMLSERCRMFKDVEPGKKYVCTVDVATGVGGDYSTINVIDISLKIFEQVAVYRSNLIELTMFPYEIQKVANYYNEALVLVENNAEGFYVCETLFSELEYPELYIEDKGIGVRTTKTTKRSGIRMLKDLMENKGFVINDYYTIQELSNFQEHGNSYRAAEGYHDDLVMGLVLFGYLNTLQTFREYFVESDIRQNVFKKRMEQLIEEDAIEFDIMATAINGDSGEESNFTAL